MNEHKRAAKEREREAVRWLAENRGVSISVAATIFRTATTTQRARWRAAAKRALGRLAGGKADG